MSVSNDYLEIYAVVDVEGSSMDLNSSPLPDEDDQTYEEPIDVDFAQSEHVESSVEIMRRVHKIPSGNKLCHAQASL